MQKNANLEKLRHASLTVQASLRSSQMTLGQAAALWNAAVSDFCREIDHEIKAIVNRNAGERDAAV